MKSKLFLKIVSIVLIYSVFLHPSLLTAAPKEDKLAAHSRFERFNTYFGSDKNRELIAPESLTPETMRIFLDSMAELNAAVLNNNPADEINTLIGTINTGFSRNGIRASLENIDERIVNVDKGPQTFKKVVLKFSEGVKRDLVFLGDCRDENVLDALGVKDDGDKRYLEIPGVKGLWVTGHEEIIDVAAGGEEQVAAAQEARNQDFYNLILADILEWFTDEQKAIIIKQSDDAEKMRQVTDALETRIMEIETAIQWAISAYAIGAISQHAKIRVNNWNKVDYFKTPFRSLLSWEEERTGTPERGSTSKSILNNDRFLKLAEDCVTEVFAGEQGQTLLRQSSKTYITEEGFRMYISEAGSHADKSSRRLLSADIMQKTGLPGLFSIASLSERIIPEARESILRNILRVEHSALDNNKQRMLGRITRLAERHGFSTLREARPEEDDGKKVISVPFGRQSEAKGDGIVYYKYLPINGVLKYYPKALERLATLAELFGEDTDATIPATVEDEASSLVGRLLNNLLITESARHEHGSEYLNSLGIRSGEDSKQEEAIQHVTIASYLAMITEDGIDPFRITSEEVGTLSLKRDWVEILAQYIWFTYFFSADFENLESLLNLTSHDIYEKTRSTLNQILGSRYSIAEVDIDRLAALLANTPDNRHDDVRGIWDIDQEFVKARSAKIDRSIGYVEEIDVAAGGERRPDGKGDETEHMNAVIQGMLAAIETRQPNQLVIDGLFGYLSGYTWNRVTASLEMVGEKIKLTGAEANMPEYLKVILDNRLQVIFSLPFNEVLKSVASEVASIIQTNLETVKTPNSIIKGRNATLLVDTDSVIYVLPGTGDSEESITRLVGLANQTQVLQKIVAEKEKTNGPKGFIDVDSKLLERSDGHFSGELYRRLLELYNEGLYVVRIIPDEGLQLSAELRALNSKFNNLARSKEWVGITPVKANTITLVSSVNIDIAKARQGDSTVIRLGANVEFGNWPQLTPALIIARAIISAGGEEFVTGDLFRYIRELYKTMVGSELVSQVEAADTISELLEIILPPISLNNLRVIEYLMLGRELAEMAA